MKYIFYILISLSLFSCKAYRERICRECTAVNKDSLSVSENTTILYDTVKVPYAVQGPIQYLENPCKFLCDSLGNLKKFEIKKKQNGIIGVIKSVGNSIAFDCNEDSLKKIIEKQTHTIKSFERKENTKTVVELCKKDHTTQFDSFMIVSSWFFWPILIIILLWKIFKGYLKNYIPFLK